MSPEYVYSYSAAMLLNSICLVAQCHVVRLLFDGSRRPLDINHASRIELVALEPCTGAFLLSLHPSVARMDGEALIRAIAERSMFIRLCHDR